MSSLGFLGVRHILPEVPILAIIAASGFIKIKKRRKVSLTFIILYQLLSVTSVEYTFISDTSDVAGEWISENIDPDEILAIDPVYAKAPRGYNTIHFVEHLSSPLNTTNLNKATFLILHEAYYSRCVTSPHSPLGYPDPENAYHAHFTTCEFIQSLFRGELPYTLIKKVETKSIVLEMILYKAWFGSYQTDDILIYRRMGDILEKR